LALWTSHLASAPVEAQGWKQIGELGLAFVLSSLIGLEREWRQKSAGLRTHTLVGVGAALLVIISKYGFNDVLSDGRVILDPSRVAAGVVSGIGFIGGGLIFVRGDIVRGLTTAAIVWMTAAIGMACGAGLVLLALVVTAAHFVVVFVYPAVAARLPASRSLGFGLRVVYEDGRGILRQIIMQSTELGLAIHRVATHQIEGGRIAGVPAVAVTLEVRGKPAIEDLTVALDRIDGVLGVETTDPAEMLAGQRRAPLDEIRGRALEDDLPAIAPGAGAQVDDPVGVRHHRLVVGDDDH
jgi:putative Mg2+ transporter-C (MgtC) family protein